MRGACFGSGERRVFKAAAAALTALLSLAPLAQAEPSCELEPLFTFTHDEIGEISVSRDPRSGAVLFKSLMHVNADGAPDSYHPEDIGTTHVCNGVSVGADCIWKADCLGDFKRAKAEGFGGPTRICFFGIATGPDEKPIVQGAGDPKPGYFVSTTAFVQPGSTQGTSAAYLDSNLVPYLVVPPRWLLGSTPGVRLGDYAIVLRRSKNAYAHAVVGDIGPRRKLGEGSVALHKALGNDPFRMHGTKRRASRGIDGRDVAYVVFPGSRLPDEEITADGIREQGEARIAAFGGVERLRACASALPQ